MSRFTAILLAASLAALLGGAGIARADGSVVYEWTDAHGEVHYTDQWVPGAKLIKIQTAHGPAGSSATQGIQSESSDASRQIQHEQDARTVQRAEAQRRAQECAQAKAQYKTLMQSRRIFTVDPNGHRHYLSDAAADAARVKALEAEQSACGS